MTLQDLSLIAQIAGVLLIPASLFFVGLQMRQTHAVERANAQRDLLNQMRDWWMLTAEDETVFASFSAGLADFATLGRYRQAKFNALCWNLGHIVEGAFWQHQAGLINASSHNGYIMAWLSIIGTPGGRQWWEETSQIVNIKFATYVNLRRDTHAGPLPLWTDLLPFFEQERKTK